MLHVMQQMACNSCMRRACHWLSSAGTDTVIIMLSLLPAATFGQSATVDSQCLLWSAVCHAGLQSLPIIYVLQEDAAEEELDARGGGNAQDDRRVVKHEDYGSDDEQDSTRARHSQSHRQMPPTPSSQVLSLCLLATAQTMTDHH